MQKFKKIYSIKYNPAFTLVELIVVIVILAILATIAFLSFSSQSSSARDSTRMADMSNIVKGLTVFSTVGGTYPIPDKSVNILSGATQIGYQGEAGINVLGMIKFSVGGGKDPLDRTYYTYNTNYTKSKAQVVGFLENQGTFSLNPFDTNKSFATDYIARYPYEKGDTLGVILIQTGTVNLTYTPLQDAMPVGMGFDTLSGAQTIGKIAIIDNSNSLYPVAASVNFIGYTGTGNTNQLQNYTIANCPAGKEAQNGSATKSQILSNIINYIGCNINNYTGGSGAIIAGTGVSSTVLVASLADDSNGIAWGYYLIVTSATDMDDGKANTDKLKGTAGTAAYKCYYKSSIPGTWYLPAKNELNVLYLKLKLAGISTWGGSLYHSSNEYNDNGSYYQFFPDGSMGTMSKNNAFYVRCVSRF